MASKEQLKAETKAQALLDANLDETTRRIVTAWAEAWDQIKGELETSLLELAAENTGGTISYPKLLRHQRLQAALTQMEATLDQLAEQTGTLTAQQAQAVAHNSTTATLAMTRAGLTGVTRAELRANLTAADPAQILAMARRTTEQITARTKALAVEAQKAIRRTMLKGIAVGDNPRKAARDAYRNIEDQWNGGLARAETIARTEMLDAHRKAAQQVEQANKDVLDSWEWVAHLGDKRICRACLGMHGTRHAIDSPGPLGHPNCRCARVPVTKTWEELGFPGMREPQNATPDAEEWFENLPEAEQEAILGKAGLAAYREGRFPRSAWAARRDNGRDWRDSYQPAPVPGSRGYEPDAFRQAFPKAARGFYPRQITPERPDEAVKRVNPGYPADKYRRYNCFNAVTAYIFRRRGWDVTAQTAEHTHGKLFHFLLDAWSTTESGKERPKLYSARGSETLTDALDRAVGSGLFPAGSQGIAQVQWKIPGIPGHVLIWEVIKGGKVRIIDPQSGTIDNGKYTNHKAQKGASNLFFRTDNAYFTGEPTDWVE
ncbi:minor capsid protein [Rothia nasimurium]|uniref:minor capsid protein n=1 Tax=Rothia nasimurium TaxID=85336 RepID=UPI001EFFD4CE|nr:minor capsid protein [Rothia nasimurium]